MQSNTPPTSSDSPRRPLTTLHGLGAQTADKLARLGLHTVQDLLFHLPTRYEDRTRFIALGSLQAGQRALVTGRLVACDQVQGRRRTLVCRIEDGTGHLWLRWFHFSAHLQRRLAPGCQLIAFGEVRSGPGGLELVHPDHELVPPGTTPTPQERLTPVYPITEGVSQQRLRTWVDAALESALQTASLPDPIGDHPLARAMSLAEALRCLHHPTTTRRADLEQARQRLALEELCAHHLGMLQARRARRTQRAPVLSPAVNLRRQFLDRVHLHPTGAQRRAMEEISADLARPQPMHRLLQGDVGSGKTLVAALAALQVVSNRHQVAVMAPTELLAEQHHQTFAAWLGPLGFRVELLTGSQSRACRQQTYADTASGAIDLLVGTHALVQDPVEFAALGLTVVDEQHRFGVRQRLRLTEKGTSAGLPHQLVLTATPIPRTLAMSWYADLDLSVIDELPPGRQPVTTRVLSNARRDQVVGRVAEALRAGRQAYWVCTLIEASETLTAQAAETTAEDLKACIPEARIGLLHGRLDERNKQQVMAAFKAGDLQLLVATTVIEVGVDVPNASLMVIENPERLGLAQLHQLRGRVGRGAAQSHCLLLYHPPLSALGKARLQVIRDHQDGFLIAEEDLRLRGPGELLGDRQTGLAQLRVADLQGDRELLPTARDLAAQLVEHRPAAVHCLIDRWLGGRTELVHA